MTTSPGYEPLAAVLQQALDQAQSGKGKERHANGLPFTEQPILVGTREVGLGGPAFQARKKILEALNCPDPDRAVGDLLGAINYAAAMVIYIREVNESNQPELTEEEAFDKAFGVALTEPPKTKRIVKSKETLKSLLVDDGYCADSDGDWISSRDDDTVFFHPMFAYCGEEPGAQMEWREDWLEEVLA